MKRMHSHASVEDSAQSVRFNSTEAVAAWCGQQETASWPDLGPAAEHHA